MKKTLALVLALAMVFSSITVAFAEGTLSADAQICADLGMLKGSTGTVDAAYTATAPTRIQAAVMFLRLKGLEAEAMAFTGEANFADADKAAWAKPIMAYLKANPQYGWQGDGTNFDPTGVTTAQQYYKVMLEALGYKQNTAEVVGDFAYADVLTFAASKGLTKVAAVTNFTVNDLAIATVEALKANVKDTTTTLVASLVEAGKVDKAKAVAANIYVDVATTEANLDAVIASGNDKVEVTFDAEVAAAFAENVANYAITVKGSTTALEVTAAKAVGTTMVELTTAAQTGGTAYTLTVGEKSLNFSGVSKSTGAPEVDTVKCIDTNTIEVVFKKAMDRASVEDVANYTLNNGATVKAAELWIDQDDSRKTVKLTTEGVANNKVYKLTIANVKSADMVALKSVSKSFTGIADTKAPTISGNVIVKNNQRLWVKFSDAHGLDKATVEDIANWSIDGLVITKITAKDDDGANFGKDDYGYYHLVEIDTEPMTASHKYTITINNLVDGSSSKNAIAKALTKTFYGVAVDKAAPKVGSIRVLGDNMVEVPFTDANRLDYATATDVSNYTFNEGLQVLSAKVLRASAPDDDATGKLIVLTTSTMDTDTTYKITIENVADEFGNVMTAVKNRNIPRSGGQDIAPPAVTKTAWVDKNTVKLTFNEKLDIDSANDPTNYSFNNGLGTITKAEISGKLGYTLVTLTTPEMATNKNYTITITGVKDRVGNEMSGYKAYFTSGQASVDTAAPEVENIVAINRNEVAITFSEAVQATSTSKLSLRTVSDTGVIGGSDIDGNVVGIDRTGYTTDDNTTITYKFAGNLSDTQNYMVYKVTGVKDLHNNTFSVPSDVADKDTFYGSSDIQDDLEVVGVDQLDMKTIQVTFSRPILYTGMLTGVDNYKSDNPGKVSGYNAKIDIENDQTTEALSVLTLTKPSGKFTADSEIVLSLGNIVDYSGTDLATADQSYEYTPYLDDTDKPVIEYVEAVNTGKVQIHFSEDMDTPGTYSIEGPYTKGSSTVTSKQVTAANTAVDSDDETIVNLNVASLNLIPGEVYTLIPKTGAKDIAGNGVEGIADLSFEFVASSVEMKNYIKGVAVIDARTVEVRGTDDLAAVKIKNGTLEIQEADGTIVYNTVSNKATVDLNQPLSKDVTYTVEATVGGTAVTYSFVGILSDGGVEVVDVAGTDYVVFSDWNVDDYVVKFVYETTPTTLVGNATNGFDADAAIAAVPAGAQYMIEVYRIIDTVTEAAPVYTRVYTK